MKIFVVILTYLKPLSEVEKYLESHIVFLDKYYASNNFIVSGKRSPRVGGVILCRFSSLEEAQKVFKEDPFSVQGIAEYNIVEFEASKGLKL
jgi:uncharacterized protein YciI